MIKALESFLEWSKPITFKWSVHIWKHKNYITNTHKLKSGTVNAKIHQYLIILRFTFPRSYITTNVINAAVIRSIVQVIILLAEYPH